MSWTGYTKATLSEIKDRIQNDINASVSGADARTEGGILNILGHVFAGAINEQSLFIDWAVDQTNTWSSDGRNLDDWGRLWGVVRKPASRAEGTVKFQASSSVIVSAGATVQTRSGIQYVATQTVAPSAGFVTVPVRATQTGFVGNQKSGVLVDLSTPVLGLKNPGTVVAITGGADLEADGAERSKEGYRGRIQARITQAPHGGSKNDYIAWAKENAGVTRVWVYPEALGAGSVKILFMMDDSYANGIPTSADATNIQSYITDDNRKPVTAKVTVVPPIPVPLNITINSLNPSTPAVKAAITGQLKDFLRTKAVPQGTIYLSNIVEEVSLAAGEVSHKVTSPTNNITYSTNQIPVLGTITYT